MITCMERKRKPHTEGKAGSGEQPRKENEDKVKAVREKGKQKGAAGGEDGIKERRGERVA